MLSLLREILWLKTWGQKRSTTHPFTLGVRLAIPLAALQHNENRDATFFQGLRP